MGGGATEHGGSGRGPAIDDAGAELNRFQECFEPVHLCVDNLRVAGAKKIGKGAKAGVVGVDNDKQVVHCIEFYTVEATEEAEGATRIVNNGLARRLLEGVKGGDSLEECILVLWVVFL